MAQSPLRLSRRPTTPTGTVDVWRSVIKRGGGGGIDGHWRGTSPQQPQTEMPCGACGIQIISRQRFALAGCLDLSERVVNNVQGAFNGGDDRPGIAAREENRPRRRRTFFVTLIVSRIHQRYRGVRQWYSRRRKQSARFGLSAISDDKEAANQEEDEQHVDGREGA